MGFFKVAGKSIAKAGKYVGLTAAGVAVSAVTGVFDPAELSRLLFTVLGEDGTTALLVPLIGQTVGGALGPVLVVALQQIYKHRDKITAPTE